MTERQAPVPGERPESPEQELGVAGSVGRLGRLADELRRLERELGPALGSLEVAGQHAAGEVARSALPAWRRLTRGEPRWPVSVAVLLMIVLQMRLPASLTLAGQWLLPGIELVLLIVLIIANPRRIDRRSPVLRGLGLALIGVASLANAGSVVLLINGLVQGATGEDAGTLLGTGANIWITNVIIFALWFWELDRSGQATRGAPSVQSVAQLLP